MTEPFLFCIMSIMKNKTFTLRKVRPRNGTDVYYTSSSWETKEVDGVVFVYVVKSPDSKETKKLMRKDSLEYVK